MVLGKLANVSFASTRPCCSIFAFTTKANRVSNIICEHCTSRKTSNAVAVDIASHAFAPKKSLEVIGSEQVGTPAVQVLSSPNQ